jgi:hypothetical protein
MSYIFHLEIVPVMNYSKASHLSFPVNYDGEANEDVKSAVKILNTARVSFKLTTVILVV